MAKLALLPLAILLFLIVGSLCSLFTQLSFSHLIQLLSDSEIQFALMLSVTTALISLLLACIISLPAAWAMARLHVPGKRIINILLDLPMVMPPLVVGIGLLLLLGQSGPLGKVAPMISQWLFSPFGIVIAQTYVACSIITRSAYAAFTSIAPAYVHTAYNLGLTPLKALCLVEIPLVWRSLLSGCVLAMSRALGEFGATLMLAGATRMKTETLPIAVYLNIASGDFSLAVGCALLLILFAVFLLLILHLLQQKGIPDVKSE
ncbi:ABC transporter permease subunit [Limnobaculum zhutongyuii]|uniref:ABC transporter permease subunit n=1 Tax=Limnobaculum zhutongyuii TaxID=2498113 RepID=A0A411WK91_9GAMM|nr:ABC transporter permease [Limnobaculum zhutongyuii]QBH96623.1 ABC transporter permease subunit [Limnobaculum zhutongyuii]TQS90346.1 ABC transporter permease subunit [Limnobaculum zhutongyuii]